ncbi:MAG: serine/threonine protein kinase [Victivallales bacterium]|nr:serine/threonine protein kinase [Victivallales bacterium]
MSAETTNNKGETEKQDNPLKSELQNPLISGKTVVMAADEQPRPRRCGVCGATLPSKIPPGEPLRCLSCGWEFGSDDGEPEGFELDGKYVIERALGSGGFGKIFLCHPSASPEKKLVLKMLRDVGEERNRVRFEREARYLMSMEHPSIVKVYDFLFDGQVYYTVMEYIDGHDLVYLRSRNEFSEEGVLIIAKVVSQALAYAWDSFRIIHRDIKPENIMVDGDNNVRLLDFGLSKRQDDSASGMTGDFACMGSPGYMSPEQYQDSTHVDFRADMFSLGATMYYLFTGEKPFSGKNMLELFQNTMQNSPNMDSLYPEFCSKGCAKFILRLMHTDRGRRYASYSALQKDLDRLIQKARLNVRTGSDADLSLNSGSPWRTFRRWIERLFHL